MWTRSVAHSRQLARVHPLAAQLFAWMVPHQDSFGRMTGDAALVKSTCVPLLEYFTVEVVEVCLGELSRCRDSRGEPLLHWYDAGGERVIHFPGFNRHNSVRKTHIAKASKFPGPTDEGVKAVRPLAVHLTPWKELPGFTTVARREPDRSAPAPGRRTTVKEGRNEVTSFPSLPLRSGKGAPAVPAAAPDGAAGTALPDREDSPGPGARAVARREVVGS